MYINLTILVLIFFFVVVVGFFLVFFSQQKLKKKEGTQGLNSIWSLAFHVVLLHLLLHSRLVLPSSASRKTKYKQLNGMRKTLFGPKREVYGTKEWIRTSFSNLSLMDTMYRRTLSVLRVNHSFLKARV